MIHNEMKGKSDYYEGNIYINWMMKLDNALIKAETIFLRSTTLVEYLSILT